ncbi:uncharacterized protein LOC126844358 [Adelges cooleyi]|uniref:uncharacterized protein LOC126844358 n=1 Tax=Adelges cooleyi TaxID=133065 RepID=UPI0021807C2E|nr:uncharacterized protein LOC126844358 [Adelges cooleyi]
MKLFCFLISYIFVNVSADYLTDYKKEVLYANASIERAYNMNDLTVGGISGANGLEHVIEIMVNENQYYKNFAKINLMIAVPEQTCIAYDIPDLPFCDNLRKSRGHQKMMEWQIRYTLGMDYPDIDQNQNFEALDLKILANNRREHVVPALRNIIRRVLDKPVQHVQDDAAILQMCRLLGLYKSAQFPRSYISSLEINTVRGTCILWDISNTPKWYRKNNGVWEQLKVEGTAQPLEEQFKII